MTHCMVDSETTDVDPQLGGVIQLSGILFNLDHMVVGPNFDACPSMLPRRRWSEQTRSFWSKHPEVYKDIVSRQRDARTVFQEFGDFCSNGAPFGGYIFVAKPVKFDWPMIESHFIDLDIPFPFAHHAYLDLHSYIAGLRGATSRTEIEDEVPFPANGKKHNSLHDCAYQIDLLFHAKRMHVHAEMLS